MCDLRVSWFGHGERVSYDAVEDLAEGRKVRGAVARCDEARGARGREKFSENEISCASGRRQGIEGRRCGARKRFARS